MKATVPQDKLLVFNLKEGWEPLRKFLGGGVPHEPFPHVNETESFKAWGCARTCGALRAGAPAPRRWLRVWPRRQRLRIGATAEAGCVARGSGGWWRAVHAEVTYV